MPDMSLEGCKDFWVKNHDPFLSRVINMMGHVEDWTFDDNVELNKLLQDITDSLDEMKRIDLKDEKLFVNLLTNVKVTRSLRFMQFLDAKLPGTASKLLIYSEVASKNTDTVTGLFLNRNLIFERLQLLARIFAPQRINLVINALELSEG